MTDSAAPRPEERIGAASPGAAPEVSARVVGFVFVTVFLDLIGFGIVIPLMPFYVKSMGGSAQTVGTLLSCFSLTQLLATPVLGRLSDRLGRRPVILLSLLGNALSMVLFALATRLTLLPLLFISRITAGATAGNLATCQAAIADVTTGTSRARGMGRLGAGIGLGMVLGPVLGGALSKFGPAAPPLGAAAMALLDLVAAFFLMPETLPKTLPKTMTSQGPGPGRDGRTHPAEGGKGIAEAAARPSLWATIRQPQVAVVLLIYFLTFLMMSHIQVALALFVDARLSWGAREVSYIFGVFGFISLVIQGGLIAKVVGRLGQVRTVNLGAVLLTAGMLLISAAHQPASLIGGLLLVGTGLGLTQPLLSTLASECAAPGQQGALLGISQSAGGLARTLGPSWAGLLFQHVGPGAPFVAGAAAGFLSLLLGLGLGGKRPARPLDVPKAKDGPSSSAWGAGAEDGGSHRRRAGEDRGGQT